MLMDRVTGVKMDRRGGKGGCLFPRGLFWCPLGCCPWVMGYEVIANICGLDSLAEAWRLLVKLLSLFDPGYT